MNNAIKPFSGRAAMQKLKYDFLKMKIGLATLESECWSPSNSYWTLDLN